jgi:cytochrome c
MKFFAGAIIVALGFLASGLLSPAVAAEKGLADKGKVLVEENCSRCHAVGLTGVSPKAEAPPLRTLSSNYPIEDLAESLAEGIVSGHPEMPIFVFKPHDVDAIIAYLESIQEAPADSEAMPEPAPGDTPNG